MIVSGLYFYSQQRQKPVIKLVNPDQFDELASDPKTFVLDVHTPEQTHISKTDNFIPYDRLEEKKDKLPKDKNTPILLYCRSGSMSEIAGKTLLKMGYKRIFDLEGGIQAYREQRVDVSLKPDTFDLGTVIYGDVAKTTFTLTNNTPKALNITKISTSCGCTKAKISKNTLEPYESIPVEVSFDPAVHKDDTDLGDLVRTIYIDTDNLNFAQVTTKIKATVIKN